MKILNTVIPLLADLFVSFRAEKIPPSMYTNYEKACKKETLKLTEGKVVQTTNLSADDKFLGIFSSLTLCILGNDSTFFWLSADLFSESTFQKNSFRKTISVPFASRSGMTKRMGLIWVLTVCKGYQQMTLRDKELMGHKMVYYVNRL